MATKRNLEKQKELLEKSINDLRVTRAGLQAMINDVNIDDSTRKDLVINLNATQSQIDKQENELEKVSLELDEKFVQNQIKSQQNVGQALDDLNAYYISSESKWYCIYS